MDNAPMQSEAASDVTLTDEDKIMADAAFDCAFRADTETIDRDMAELFARHRIAATRKHDPSALVDALKALIPTNVGDNRNIPDDFNLPCDISMGELRQARAALAAWEASQ